MEERTEKMEERAEKVRDGRNGMKRWLWWMRS